jgi:hypothetical protein
MSSSTKTATVRDNTPQKPSQQSAAKTAYLLSYNFLCAVLWLTVLGRTVVGYAMVGKDGVWRSTDNFVRWTQTLAAIEVINSAFGRLRISRILPLHCRSSTLRY